MTAQIFGWLSLFAWVVMGVLGGLEGLRDLEDGTLMEKVGAFFAGVVEALVMMTVFVTLSVLFILFVSFAYFTATGGLL
jgi:hypothetical protein